MNHQYLTKIYSTLDNILSADKLSHHHISDLFSMTTISLKELFLSVGPNTDKFSM